MRKVETESIHGLKFADGKVARIVSCCRLRRRRHRGILLRKQILQFTVLLGAIELSERRALGLSAASRPQCNCRMIGAVGAHDIGQKRRTARVGVGDIAALTAGMGKVNLKNRYQYQGVEAKDHEVVDHATIGGRRHFGCCECLFVSSRVVGASDKALATNLLGRWWFLLCFLMYVCSFFCSVRISLCLFFCRPYQYESRVWREC